VLIRRHLRGPFKPPQGATINWGHPLAANLTGAWLFNEQGGLTVRNLVNPNDNLAIVGSFSPLWIPNQLGSWTPDTSANSRGLRLATASALLKPADAASLFWRGSFNGATGANNPDIALISANSANTSPFVAYGLSRSTGDTSAIVYIDDAGGTFHGPAVTGLITVGQITNAAVTFRNGGNCTGYWKGRKVVQNARSGSLSYSGTSGMNVSVKNDNSGAMSFNDVIYTWNRELSATENQWLNDEPYALLEYAKPRTFFFTAAPAFAVDISAGVQAGTSFTESMAAARSTSFGVTAGTSFTASTGNSIAPGVQMGTAFSVTMAGARSITLGVTAGTSTLNPFPQTVTPSSGVLISVVPGSPAMEGGAQTVINQTGVKISVVPGGPTIVGGPQYLQAFIGNIDRSAYLIPMGVNQPKLGGGGGGGGTGAAGAGPVTIQYNAIGRASASFDLFVGDGSGWVPRAKQTVILQEFGRKLFAGCLKSVSSEPINAQTSKFVFHCIATDKSSICDNRVAIKTYPVGTGIQTMILDLVSNFLNGEGITTEGVNVAGTLDAPMIFNTVSVTQAFDQITLATGAQWWVDMNGVLNFAVIASAPVAPFSLTDTSRNWRNLVASETLTGFANTFYAVSNLVVQPGGSGHAGVAREETYTLANIGGQPWQQAAFNAGLAPGYLLLDLPINVLVSVTVNGVSQNVWNAATQDYTVAGWYFYSGPAIVFPFVTPSIGDVIVVRYIPVYQNSTVNTADPLSGTCGSGKIEAVIQVPNIAFQSDLDAIAQAYQDRNGTIPYIVSFETDEPGLEVGQALTTAISFIPALVSGTLYITSITATKAAAGQFDLGFSSSFRWVIEATTQQNLGNWVNWFERIIKRTQFPLPLPRYEVAPFVLAPGSSLGGGTVGTNPVIVQNAGQVFEAVAAFTTPPVGQDLLINFLINGVPVFAPGGELVIPAGSTALATQTTFAVPGLFVFRGDIILITASYRVLSASPVAASSGSANLNWSY
jgi:hypothetical protein